MTEQNSNEVNLMTDDQREALHHIHAMPASPQEHEPNVAHAMATDLLNDLRWEGVDPELVRKAEALAQATL